MSSSSLLPCPSNLSIEKPPKTQCRPWKRLPGTSPALDLSPHWYLHLHTASSSFAFILSDGSISSFLCPFVEGIWVWCMGMFVWAFACVWIHVCEHVQRLKVAISMSLDNFPLCMSSLITFYVCMSVCMCVGSRVWACVETKGCYQVYSLTVFHFSYSSKFSCLTSQTHLCLQCWDSSGVIPPSSLYVY